MVEQRLPRLVVRSPLLPREPLHLACLRVAALNGLGNLSWLTSLARLPRSFHSVPCDLRPLAELFGVVDPADLAAAATWPDPTRAGFVRSFAGPLPSRSIDVAFPKVCPTCIASGMRCDPIWDLRAYRACAVHECRMVEACPRCDRALTLFRKAPGRCACGGDLAASSPVPAGDRLVAVSRLLAALVSTPTSHALSLSDALRLLWLAGTTEVDDGAWRALFLSRPRGDAMDSIIEAAAPCLLEWPGAFHDWLSTRWRTVPGRTGIEYEYGGLPSRLRAAFDTESAVLLETRVAMAANASGSPVRTTSFFHQQGAAAAVMTGTVAARRLRMTSARLTKLMHAHGRVADTRAMGRRHLHLVPTNEIDRLTELDAGIVTRVEAARLLGTSAFQVDALICARILQVGCGPKRSGLRETEVRALIDSLSRRCRDASSDVVSLSELPLRRHLRLADVVAAVLDGRIPLHVRDGLAKGLDRFGVPAAALVGQRFGEHGQVTFGVRETAALIGVSTRMVTALVRARCLHRAVGAPSKCGITSASVTAFRRDYVMAKELARSYSTSTRVVALRLAANGTRMVVPSDSRRGISAVWLRSDVGRRVP